MRDAWGVGNRHAGSGVGRLAGGGGGGGTSGGRAAAGCNWPIRPGWIKTVRLVRQPRVSCTAPATAARGAGLLLQRPRPGRALERRCDCLMPFDRFDLKCARMEAPERRHAQNAVKTRSSSAQEANQNKQGSLPKPVSAVLDGETHPSTRSTHRSAALWTPVDARHLSIPLPTALTCCPSHTRSASI